MSCRVWAPNALAVSLVGDFNAWNEEAHPLHKVSDGVWACFLPEMLPEFTLYKFCVTAKDGQKTYKSDPYAYHYETRPWTAMFGRMRPGSAPKRESPIMLSR